MSTTTPDNSQPAARVKRRTFLGGVAGAGAAGLAGLSLLTAPSAATAPTAPAIPGTDTDPLDLLKRMLSFDTQNFGSGANTRTHAEMLQEVWTRAGVPVEIIDTPQPNNVHLIARIPGTGQAEPLLLLGHSDVVPVELENWTADPFGGEIRNGEIYGRGALDMKGANAASIAALLRHLSEGARFDRDIIVLTDCDEEAGSFGSRWLAANYWDKLDAGSVLTEGGWFLAQDDGTTPMLISATRQDKVYFNIDLTARGTATHSSKPLEDAAIVTLARAVARLGDWQAPVYLTDVTREYFRALSRATKDHRFAQALRRMLDARNPHTLERWAQLVIAKSPYPALHSALLRTTHAFVIENAGYKENVIPSSAQARLNCRAVPGGQKPREFLAQVRRQLARSDAEVTIAAPEGVSEEEYLATLDETWATPPADIDTDLFSALTAAAKETYPGARFTPALFEAGTSLAPWRSRGIPGYGVYPYVLSKDQLIGMHGNDERIFTEALVQGTDYMYSVFSRFRV
ncbi:M20/M25/M40 family metallo-hydrolase [Arthrobacter sp. 7Tela_A1]|uniref:M20/M25/M40 family metallo-hydrolase n=1 Tax=Arthrobacter sp. 7Tela_A1 TaxID=3093745 RepID=UPI003BB51ADD